MLANHRNDRLFPNLGMELKAAQWCAGEALLGTGSKRALLGWIFTLFVRCCKKCSCFHDNKALISKKQFIYLFILVDLIMCNYLQVLLK